MVTTPESNGVVNINVHICVHKTSATGVNGYDLSVMSSVISQQASP